ncbi:DUF6099 family protein [Kitasatospora sp. DSM 101779]|uniref:DUF6099 family protein n=1 Tax=Kitasatospora sp. DSM 101779 TaxID=2853165 RepID=UPI0021D97524|nr:DUF6099 family protein [Kitasatospora sp. DSM 101779]MCU7824765.1 hypothetical protein [Kitasatospora sp. DSM 101779]
MDALRLIKTTRHALAEARTAQDVLLEARQAGLLTEAVGARIAEQDAGEIGALGQLLCDAGAHAAGCLDDPPAVPDTLDTLDALGPPGTDWAGGRARRLDDLGELDPVLCELCFLLHEVAEALVVLACGADAESVYWRCIDGVDAGADCKEVAADLLRAVRREKGLPPPEEDGPEYLDEGVSDVSTGRAADALSGPSADLPLGRGVSAQEDPSERFGPLLSVRLGPPVGAAAGAAGQP